MRRPVANNFFPCVLRPSCFLRKWLFLPTTPIGPFALGGRHSFIWVFLGYRYPGVDGNFWGLVLLPLLVISVPHTEDASNISLTILVFWFAAFGESTTFPR